MNIPHRERARAFLAEAEMLNPGPWVQHSLFVAQAAEAIAEAHPDLDAETGYILGILHDIGRRAGVTNLRHIIDGYTFLHALGFEDAAQISMTHSFPVRDIRVVNGQWDCSPEELQFIEAYLAQVEFSTYDRLLQLCDALALPSGFCLIEKRLVDVALRHGVHEHTLARWRGYFAVQAELEAAIGASIYSLLPGVIENTFAPMQVDPETCKPRSGI
ncbi:MAG: HD domain-containing protein [Caldilineaceae bacterium]|nr:HD domain-containing protein [Caldilineaceae bacterium]